MAASSFAPSSARARAPRPIAARPVVGCHQPLILWMPVVTAAVGSVVLVAVYFMILPPRHSAAAAPEDVQTAQLLDDHPRTTEVAPAAELIQCPPPPAAPTDLAPNAPALTDPAAPVVVQSVPATEDQPLPKAAEVDQSAFVTFTAPAPPRTPGCQQCGTAVDFYDSPAIANKNAIKDDKLVFVLHVAGNFEQPGFT
jgi:hypothetical protein